MRLSRFAAAIAFSAIFAAFLAGQTPAGQTPAGPTPASPTISGQSNALPAAPTTPPPPPDPTILEDGGFSIEPFYWYTRPQPDLRGGKQATAYGNLIYPGKSKEGLGVELGVPAGRANTLRFSYFRVQGNSNSTLNRDSTIFSQGYDSGDYIAANYRVQNAKVSWDYLSYTFKNHIRFKTLYEFQWTTISTTVSAPLAAVSLDPSTGDPIPNTSTGSKNVFYPTLGVEFQQPVNKHLRWEVRGSGFGLPHHSVIWDAQADIAVRFSSLEFFIGGKAFHFKTSPNSDEYFTDTLEGAVAGIRYYLSKPTQ